MAPILFGLLAAAFYGAADFCGGLAARRTAIFAVTIVSQLAGLVALLLILGLTHWRLSQSDFLYGALAGVCAGGGLALFYHALAVGRMGVVSPITAVLASAVPVIASLVRGEHLRVTQIVGMLIALIAIVLIAASFEEGESSGKREIATEGVREALIAGVVIGGFILFLSHAQPASGIAILLPARAASVLVLLAIAAAFRGAVRPSVAALPLIVVCGVLDMAANAFFVLSARSGYVSIAAVLTGLYPASTVLLALIVLRERLQRVQQLGVVLALAGVVLIAA